VYAKVEAALLSMLAWAGSLYHLGFVLLALC
jgi:hypothetical protein